MHSSVQLLIRAVKELIPLRRTRIMEQIVLEKTKGIVQSGPFRGVKYISRSHIHSAFSPKLLGTYERELSGPLEEAISQRYSLVIDVGAGEGYYAVGLALRLKEAKIIAFEMESSARDLLRELAQLNNVQEQITVHGFCTKQSLASHLSVDTTSLLICDAEGAEAILLDPVRIPALRNTFILVELHEGIIGGLSEEIRERFASTHIVRSIPQEPRARSEFPYKTLSTTLVPSFIDYAMDERRAYQQMWYWITPKMEAKSMACDSQMS
jgi:hypothetical protein